MTKYTLKSVYSTITMALAIVSALLMIHMFVSVDTLVEMYSTRTLDRMFLTSFAIMMFFLTSGVFVLTDGRKGTIIPVIISLILLFAGIVY